MHRNIAQPFREALFPVPFGGIPMSYTEIGLHHIYFLEFIMLITCIINSSPYGLGYTSHTGSPGHTGHTGSSAVEGATSIGTHMSHA